VLADGKNFCPKSFISDTHNLQTEFNIQDKMEQATETSRSETLSSSFNDKTSSLVFFLPVMDGILIKSFA
jgi:hypothetical protein